MIVLLHGFMDSPHTWDLVRPYLPDDVLTPALPGHLGGPPLNGDLDLAAHVERVMDAAGVERAHIVGNSLGGYLALVLAARGRAESVVALAPAGGGDHSETLALQERLAGVAGVAGTGRARVPLPVEITPAVARRATALLTVRYEHLPPEAIAYLVAGAAACDAAPLLADARQHGWPLDTAKVRCPVRVIWGLADQLLPWPASAEGYRRSLDAEWVELDDVGHAPQLDIPLETAQLILGFTTARIASSNGPSSSPFSR
ncbi:alpha/beta hydrolase [Solirubrobacter ginsenosidimutans]|uniref:Alpha/beta hydrolase n=1 Tax=Solirubrobacter ginsenosidimutans TaxID=490573 RepID=A0A9X3S3Z2_9ACTN|nr:alpha/beta hydrolase [Solirubrobacter ginsenosidimutans]MDA0163907.1 alpha/beta hydrolase [Solirubrobacter ginsenosidimutans]